MTLALTHPSIPLILNWPALLVGCRTLSCFTGRIDKLADKIADVPEDQPNPFYHKSGKDASNKFKGDVLEVFTELLIKGSRYDDRVGIADYKNAPVDMPGVDGFGVALDGTPATVQVKYRAWDHVLDFTEHLNNFRMISFTKFGVNPETVGNMLIITTGQEIHWNLLERQFGGKIRCIGRDTSYGCIKGAQKHTVDGLFSLKTMTDNNEVFWTDFMELIAKVIG